MATLNPGRPIRESHCGADGFAVGTRSRAARGSRIALTCRGSFVADVRAPAGSAALGPDPHHRAPIAIVRKPATIAYPHPRHPHRSACGRVRPARWRGPKLPPVFRTDLADARPLFRVCAGHRPAAQGRDDRLMHRHLDTPTGYMKRAPDRRFRRSGALSARGGR
jgi:hypothetical protein